MDRDNEIIVTQRDKTIEGDRVRDRVVEERDRARDC